MNYENAPWYSTYGDTPRHLEYPDCSMYGMLARTAAAHPRLNAYEFMGFKTSYARLMDRVDACAKALLAQRVKPGDRVTICLPNIPQAMDMVYAVNRIGAVANMVHPLSAEKEISFCLNDSRSVCAITMDGFADKLLAVLDEVPRLRSIIVTGPEDMLNLPVRILYRLKERRLRAKKFVYCMTYQEFLKKGRGFVLPPENGKPEDDAVILYSGGTTGTSKGILITNGSFNAVACQVVATNTMFSPGDKMLAVLPMFHGFGLGICVHAMMANGGCAVLIPRFNLKSYARALDRKKPNFLAGVPTMYEALIHLDSIKNIDLSCLKGVYCGGDSLGIELKKNIDSFLRSHGSPVPIREGYGLTECIAVSCLTPSDIYREGSIGVPLPDMLYRITAPGTEEEVPFGTEGEICICGPTVMKEYANCPEETAKTLVRDAEGHLWLHTGDLGSMDSDGFVYFRQRLKRMIITSGYNVYPSAIEQLLDAHEAVHMSCVVGVDDPYRIKKVKAYIVLKEGIPADDIIRGRLTDYLRKHVARYAVPREIVFMDKLPLTKMNKVDYRKLEQM